MTTTTQLPAEVLTAPQRSMLRSHEMVDPSPVAWTHDLGSRRTWDWLYARGYLAGGKLTDKARAALSQLEGG